MLRICYCGVVFVLALFSASCGCGDSECPDVGAMSIKESCVGDTICTYSESFGMHAEFCVFDCLPGYQDFYYADYADTVTFQCSEGQWIIIDTTGDNCDETSPPDPCRVIDDGGAGVSIVTGGSGGLSGSTDAGRWDGSNGNKDSSTDEDAGSDDDPVN